MSAYDDIAAGLDEIFRSAFVSGSTKGSYKQKYRPEYDRVKAYLDGGALPSPFPTTLMGTGLTKVERGRRALVPEPPPPPPPTGTAIPADGIIRSGGVWYGDPFVGTVRIATAEPVTITGQLRNLTGGNVIHVPGGTRARLTVERVEALGGATPQTSGRFIDCGDTNAVTNLTVRNCTIDYTRGVDVALCDGSTILITRNRHRNIQGLESPFIVGNFVQLRVFRPTSCEISWNEILNEYGKSEPSDIFGFYYVVGVHAHNNYIQHQSRVGNLTPSSQGTITIDNSDTPGSPYNTGGHHIHDNQIVDAYGIVTYVTYGGDNNLVENNRIISDRLLPNGQQKANGIGSPLSIIAGGSNNHAHGNIVGFVDAQGTYVTEAVLAANFRGGTQPHTAAEEAALNTILPLAQINAAAEAAEWDRWLAKVAANGVTIGA